MDSIKLAIAFGLALAGCSKPPPEVSPAAIDPHRAAVTQTLAALDDIARQLPSLRLDAPSPTLALTATRYGTHDQLQGRVSLSSTIAGPMPDGIVLDATMIGPQHQQNPDMPLGERATFIENARRWVTARTPVPGATALAVQDCQRVAALTSVIIVRTVAETPPRVVSSSSFETGTYTGEALAFQLSGGHATFVGGFRFAATNSPDVRVRWEQNREYQQAQWLSTDLTYNAYVAFFGEVHARLPSAQLKPVESYRSTL